MERMQREEAEKVMTRFQELPFDRWMRLVRYERVSHLHWDVNIEPYESSTLENTAIEDGHDIEDRGLRLLKIIFRHLHPKLQRLFYATCLHTRRCLFLFLPFITEYPCCLSGMLPLYT
jgi:hypothetical protein